MGYFVLIVTLVALIGVQKGGVDQELILNALDNATARIETYEFVTNTTSEVMVPVMNVVGATAYYMAYVTFEVSKASILFATEYVHIDPQVLIYLVMAAICVPLITPLIYLLVIIGLLINEWRLNRKEKKELMKQ